MWAQPLGRGMLRPMCQISIPSNHPSPCLRPGVVAEEWRPPSNSEVGAACSHLQLHPSLLARKSGITLPTQHRYPLSPAQWHLLHPNLWMSNLLLCHLSHLHHERPAPRNRSDATWSRGPLPRTLLEPRCQASEPLCDGRAPLLLPPHPPATPFSCHPLLLPPQPPPGTGDMGSGSPSSPRDVQIA